MRLDYFSFEACRSCSLACGALQISSRVGSFPALEIAGERDKFKNTGFMGTLAALADGQDEIHVKLAALAYCDPRLCERSPAH
jgi:hypothetical protein